MVNHCIGITQQRSEQQSEKMSEVGNPSLLWESSMAGILLQVSFQSRWSADVFDPYTICSIRSSSQKSRSLCLVAHVSLIVLSMATRPGQGFN